MTVQNVLLFGNNASERFVLSNKTLICRVFFNDSERMTKAALGVGVAQSLGSSPRPILVAAESIMFGVDSSFSPLR